MSNVLPDGWSKMSLPDICYFQEGPGLRRWQYTTEGYPFINIRCIKKGYLDLDNVQFISLNEAQEKYQHFFLNEGDYVLSSSGTLGRMAKVKKSDLPIMLNTSVIRFRSTDERLLCSTFLPYYLQSKEFVDQIKEESQGSAQVNFGPTHLKLLTCSIPTHSEQQKIAKILTSVDEVIEKTQAQIDKLKDLKTGMMQELLTSGIGHTEFKDSPVGRIPAEWEVVTFSTVLKKIDSGWSPSCSETPPSSGKWGVLKVSAVTRGEFLEVQSKELPVALEPRSHIRVKKGDILLTRANGVAELVGKCVMVREEPKRKLMMSDKILRLNPNDNIDPDFLLHSFNSEQNRKQIELSWGGSSGQKNISQTDIKLYKLALPPIEEQRNISKCISQVEGVLLSKGKKLEGLTNIKKALMQDLLTGKVRVKVDS